jgi:amino acid adenylation domain-containing protein
MEVAMTASHRSPNRDSAPAGHDLEIIERANATEHVFPEGDSLLHLPFYARAARDPDAAAVIHQDGVLTYGDLADLADTLADALRAGGIGPGDIVAIAMDKGFEQVVAAIGSLSVGAVFVPVDPNYPTERFHHLLHHSGAACVATTREVDERVSWPVGTVRLHVGAGEPATKVRRPVPRAVAAPDDLAYIIYTSGSTGQPKGVMITHRGALNTVLDVNERFRVGPGDRVFAISAFTFDLAIYDIFGTLAAGATIVVPPRTPGPDAAAWLEAVQEHEVTVWQSVPALMGLVVEVAAGRGDRGRMPTLRVALLGGDWLDLALPDRIRALAPDAVVASGGGATEASIWSIVYEIGETDPDWRSIPYGKPMANQWFHILRPDGTPCAVGEDGELHIGGVGVAAGYWRDPERTEASFVRDPRTGQTVYRTGDLGRYLPDGNIEFLGRKDFQVKIQGFRVELGEVETALRRHPDVVDAAAVARPDAVGDLRLFGYVATRSTEAVDLREFLREKLPHYMVPDAVVALAALPRTSSGKIDRRALPDPAEDQQDGGAFVAPKGAVEEVLVSLWEEVLGREELGADAEFFELGGNSLRALRLMAAVNAVLDVDIAVAELFKAPTPAEFRALLESDAQTWPQVSAAAEELAQDSDDVEG